MSHSGLTSTHTETSRSVLYHSRSGKLVVEKLGNRTNGESVVLNLYFRAIALATISRMRLVYKSLYIAATTSAEAALLTFCHVSSSSSFEVAKHVLHSREVDGAHLRLHNLSITWT